MRLEGWRNSGKNAWAYAKQNGIIPQTFSRRSYSHVAATLKKASRFLILPSCISNSLKRVFQLFFAQFPCCFRLCCEHIKIATIIAEDPRNTKCTHDLAGKRQFVYHMKRCAAVGNKDIVLGVKAMLCAQKKCFLPKERMKFLFASNTQIGCSVLTSPK